MNSSQHQICCVKNITVKFGDVIALDRVNLNINKEEIIGIVGENGAGKSTLMHVIVGIIKPIDGEIWVDGEKMQDWSPDIARKKGISMVFQRFRLIKSLTVAENVMLGLKEEGLLYRRKTLNNRVQEVIDRFGLDLNAATKVEVLSQSARQRVEILRVIFRGARLVILDEPTSVLSPIEANKLLAWIKEVKKKGIGIILISHKLSEIMDVADRIVVMRNGRMVGEFDQKGEVSHKEIVRLIVGGDIENKIEAQLKKKSDSPIILLDNINLRDTEDPRESLNGLSLAIYPGEIVGIAGVSGNGQKNLAKVVYGMKKIDHGRIWFMGEDATNRGLEFFISKGVRFIPEDRDHLGVASELPILDNAAMRFILNRKGIFIKWQDVIKIGHKIIENGKVVCNSIHQKTSSLSGGNLQRLILEREINDETLLLIAHELTQGLDMRATRATRNRIVKLCEKGKAILLISTDLDEIIELSSRIFVIFKGKLFHIDKPYDKEKIGRYMIGYI